jgi:hypothetical protein
MNEIYKNVTNGTTITTSTSTIYDKNCSTTFCIGNIKLLWDQY